MAWDAIPYSTALESSAKSWQAVCFGSLAQRSLGSRETIQRVLAEVPKDAWKIFDVNLRQAFYSEDIVTSSLQLANVLKLSDEELPVLAKYYGLAGEPGAQIPALIERFDLQLVAYTLGADGSELFTASEHDFTKPNDVKAVDTVGAGDSFTAALCVGLLHDLPLTDCNRFANQVAAYVCSQVGACPPLPQDIHQSLQQLVNQSK